MLSANFPTEFEFARADCPDQEAGGLGAFMLDGENGSRLEVHGCTGPNDASRAVVSVYGSLLAKPGTGELPIGNWMHTILPVGWDSVGFDAGTSITVTEWGEPGEMIAGTFTATDSLQFSFVHELTVHGEFRICRGPDSDIAIGP